MLKRDSAIAMLSAVVGGVMVYLMTPGATAHAQAKPTLTWKPIGQTPIGNNVNIALISTNGEQLKVCNGGPGTMPRCTPAVDIN